MTPEPNVLAAIGAGIVLIFSCLASLFVARSFSNAALKAKPGTSHPFNKEVAKAEKDEADTRAAAFEKEIGDIYTDAEKESRKRADSNVTFLKDLE